MNVELRIVEIPAERLPLRASRCCVVVGWMPATLCAVTLAVCTDVSDFETRKHGVRFGPRKLDQRAKIYGTHILFSFSIFVSLNS